MRIAWIAGKMNRRHCTAPRTLFGLLAPIVQTHSSTADTTSCSWPFPGKVGTHNASCPAGVKNLVNAKTNVVSGDIGRLCEDSVHRIGRTGRAGAKGIAYTFFTAANARHAKELLPILVEAGQPVNPELSPMVSSSRGGGGSHHRGRGSGYGGRGFGGPTQSGSNTKPLGGQQWSR
ncbi:unnamed protein product [Sphagnum balticum]